MPAPPLESLIGLLRERRARTQEDRILAERLQGAFEGARAIDAAGLSFYVFEGAVSVYGPVTSVEVRDRVLDLLARTPGIRQITDYLTVTPVQK